MSLIKRIVDWGRNFVAPQISNEEKKAIELCDWIEEEILMNKNKGETKND